MRWDNSNVWYRIIFSFFLKILLDPCALWTLQSSRWISRHFFSAAVHSLSFYFVDPGLIGIWGLLLCLGKFQDLLELIVFAVWLENPSQNWNNYWLIICLSGNIEGHRSWFLLPNGHCLENNWFTNVSHLFLVSFGAVTLSSCNSTLHGCSCLCGSPERLKLLFNPGVLRSLSLDI